MRSSFCVLALGFALPLLGCSASRDPTSNGADGGSLPGNAAARAGGGGTGNRGGASGGNGLEDPTGGGAAGRGSGAGGGGGGSNAGGSGGGGAIGGVAGAGQAGSTTGPRVVGNQTLDGLLVMGYQGWFTYPESPAGMPRWVHWTDSAAPPAPGNITFDAWPDLSEFAPEELKETAFRYSDGRGAGLYSAANPVTVERHLRWAMEYGIDGFFLQRFLNEISSDPVFKLFRDTVAKNILASSETHGRVFAIEYDISGARAATWLDDLKTDWQYLVDSLKLTASSRYLQHRGRPLLAVWGLGFTDRPGTPAEANAMIDWFTRDAPAAYQATLVGGIPTHWRTLTQDSKTDPAWAAVYRRFPVIHPWMVGRYRDDAGVADFMLTNGKADLAEAKRIGADFLPVLFPGFSWANLREEPAKFNEIPRRGGAFFWKQFYEFVNAGCSMAFGAMFDEVDEATALFKIAPSKASAPTTGTFLTLDADGLQMSSDFYLRLAGAGAQILRKQAPLSPVVPVPLVP